MKKILVLSAIISACGSSSSSKNEPTVSNRPIIPTTPPRPAPTTTPLPEPDPNKRIKFIPDARSPEWSDSFFMLSGGEPGNFGILPSEVAAAESLFRFWEGIRNNGVWNETITHGFIPKEYLSNLPKTPNNILWEDATNGKILGFDKVKAVIPELINRCPSLLDAKLQAPLKVIWSTEKETPFAGRFFSNFVVLRWERNRVTYAANGNLFPSLHIRAEFIRDYGNGHWDGWKWPKQTFKEQTGGKSWADGGISVKALDQTFAHEYGHFLIQAWALNNGKSLTQSQYFAEGWAEFFKTLCWGNMHDNPAWIKAQIDFETEYGRVPFSEMEDDYRESNHRFARGSEYDLDSIGDLITWEMHNKQHDPDTMFRAGLLALNAVKGRRIVTYPVVSPLDGLLADSPHWSDGESFARPEISGDSPVVITRAEWLRNFCNAYESLGKSCGHMRKIIEADAEGLERDEY